MLNAFCCSDFVFPEGEFLESSESAALTSHIGLIFFSPPLALRTPFWRTFILDQFVCNLTLSCTIISKCHSTGCRSKTPRFELQVTSLVSPPAVRRRLTVAVLHTVEDDQGKWEESKLHLDGGLVYSESNKENEKRGNKAHQLDLRELL